MNKQQGLNSDPKLSHKEAILISVQYVVGFLEILFYLLADVLTDVSSPGLVTRCLQEGKPVQKIPRTQQYRSPSSLFSIRVMYQPNFPAGTQIPNNAYLEEQITATFGRKVKEENDTGQIASLGTRKWHQSKAYKQTTILSAVFPPAMQLVVVVVVVVVAVIFLKNDSCNFQVFSYKTFLLNCCTSWRCHHGPQLLLPPHLVVGFTPYNKPYTSCCIYTIHHAY